MEERDYKVVYKSKMVPREGEPDLERRRSRIPTAFDPYDDSYDTRGPRRPRDERDYSRESDYERVPRSSEAPRSAYTRTTYSVSHNVDSEEAFVDADRSVREGDGGGRGSAPLSRRSTRSTANELDSASRQTVIGDERDVEIVKSRRGPSEADARRRERDIGIDIGGRRGAPRDYYMDDRVQRDGNKYVVDARNGKVLEVMVPERTREEGAQGSPYLYDDRGTSRKQIYYTDRDTRDDKYSSAVEVVRRDTTPPSTARGARREIYRQPRSTASENDPGNSDTDDWRLVETLRDTRLSPASTRDPYADPPVALRPRAETRTSEDSFVLVSPSNAQTPLSPRSPRSAIARRDYQPQELRRRRSRSISFRESEAEYHDASERRHERPGAEARIAGMYLRSGPSIDDDLSSMDGDTRRSHVSIDNSRPRPRQTYDERSRNARYEERSDDRYRDGDRRSFAPQTERSLPRRERDRERPRKRDNYYDDGPDDDRSYYSEKVERTHVRETR